MTVVNSSDILNHHMNSQAVEYLVCLLHLGTLWLHIAFPNKLPRKLGIPRAVGDLLRKLFLGRFEYFL